MSPPTSGKRKADLLDINNFENVDPVSFSKRSKGSLFSSPANGLKPSNFVLKTTSTTAIPESLSSPVKPSSTPRRTLQPKSPMTKLNTAAKSSPVSALAGRSPTRSKRSGLLSNRRRTLGPYGRVDPPSFDLSAPAPTPFSLDAALKGTIPTYSGCSKGKARQSRALLADAKAGWFFDIHEDTPEQEMTNMLQHGTCVLDISSDEETEMKAKREKDDGADKENIPPPNDVSQTPRRLRNSVEDMVTDKERAALGELNVSDFYAENYDETTVVYVDEEDETEVEDNSPLDDFEFAPRIGSFDKESKDDIDALVSQPSEGSSKAAVLQPIDGTGESFDLWESGSAKDEAEA